MSSATVVSRDSSVVIAEEAHRLQWGAIFASALSAIGVMFFLLTLGTGVGLALTPTGTKGPGTAFVTLGAVYFFASVAFGFAVGGYLVGRLIGPEIETRKEEEFRAAAPGCAVWGLIIFASLLVAGVSSGIAGSTLVATAASPAGTMTLANTYWLDLLFRPAQNSALLDTDKREASHIWAAQRLSGRNEADDLRLTRLVSQDAQIPMSAAAARVNDTERRMAAAAQKARDEARRSAMVISVWTAFALLFGAFLSASAAIAARWSDDRINFSFAPRRQTLQGRL